MGAKVGEPVGVGTKITHVPSVVVKEPTKTTTFSPGGGITTQRRSRAIEDVQITEGKFVVPPPKVEVRAIPTSEQVTKRLESVRGRELGKQIMTRKAEFVLGVSDIQKTEAKVSPTVQAHVQAQIARDIPRTGQTRDEIMPTTFVGGRPLGDVPKLEVIPPLRETGVKRFITSRGLSVESARLEQKKQTILTGAGIFGLGAVRGVVSAVEHPAETAAVLGTFAVSPALGVVLVAAIGGEDIVKGLRTNPLGTAGELVPFIVAPTLGIKAIKGVRSARAKAKSKSILEKPPAVGTEPFTPPLEVVIRPTESGKPVITRISMAGEVVGGTRQAKLKEGGVSIKDLVVKTGEPIIKRVDIIEPKPREIPTTQTFIKVVEKQRQPVLDLDTGKITVFPKEIILTTPRRSQSFLFDEPIVKQRVSREIQTSLLDIKPSGLQVQLTKRGIDILDSTDTFVPRKKGVVNLFKSKKGQVTGGSAQLESLFEAIGKSFKTPDFNGGKALETGGAFGGRALGGKKPVRLGGKKPVRPVFFEDVVVIPPTSPTALKDIGDITTIIKSRVEVRAKPIISSALRIKVKPSIKVKPMIDTKLDTLSKAVVGVVSIGKVETDIISKLDVKIKQEQIQRQIPVQEFISKTSTITRTRTIPKPKSVKIPRIAKFSDEEEETKFFKLLKKKKRKAFAAFVKRRGKFRQVSPGTTKEAALDIGAKISKATLAATFKVREVAGKQKRIITGGEFGRLRTQFRAFKKVKGRRIALRDTFIELRGKRLTTKAEVFAIQKARTQTFIKSNRRTGGGFI